MDTTPIYGDAIYDSTTGTWYLVDALTGQLVTMADATGQQTAPVTTYDPSSRQPDVRQQIIAQYPAGASFVPPDAGRVAVDAAGHIRPDLTPLLPAPVAEQPPSAGAASSPGGGGSGGYDPYNPYYRSSYRSAYDTQPTVPRYGNNTTHPYFGGDMPTPGGVFAQRDSGYDNRQQVTSTSGATAGPYAVHAAEAPRQSSYGGNASGGGGGGGIAKDLYWHFANQIKGKLMGQSSGSYGSYPTSNTHPYRGPDDPRTQRKLDRFNDKRASQASFLSHPEFAIPKGIDLNSPLGERLSGLAGGDLALLAGAGKRNWSGGMDPTGDIYTAYYKKLGKRLDAGRQGIDFFPYYRKQMRRDNSLDQYRGMLNRLYQGVAAGKQLDTAQLFGNLTHPAKGTYLRQQFHNAPAGGAADQYLQSFNAILGAGEYGDVQRKALATLARNAVTAYGQRFAGRNPRHTPSLNQWVGQQLRPYL